jgi:hypothetical protein
MNARFVSVLIVVALVVTSPLRAETAEQWIAKARAYLGNENALNAVTTIHFTGTLETLTKPPAVDRKSQPSDQLEKLPVEIIFQKPYQQQMTVTRPTSIDTMVLDDYDGWAKSTVRQNPKQWQVSLLDGDQIKQLRANTWENLNFFSGLEKRGGSVQLGEDTTVDGVVCAKLSFIHSERIVFNRYFDKTSGRLVKTETANGSEIREEGEITVNEIRFPKRIINKTAAGQITTIVFETVVLNERIPASVFAVPSLRPD